MKQIRWTINALLALAVAGCGSPDLADLEHLVDEASRASAQAVPAAPVAREFVFEYRAMAERSPFEPFKDVRGATAAEAPDPKRRSQPPERFQLGQLELVGTLAGRNRMLALIRDPDRTTHALAAGDYLGRDHGRIVQVRETRIDILEHVEDGHGGWTARPRTLELRVLDHAGDEPVQTDNGDSEA